MTDDRSEGVEVTPAASSPQQPAAIAALANTMARLGEVLKSETTALRARRPADLDSFCDRKNQALLELSRVGQKLEREKLSPELREKLDDLRTQLGENQALLALHLRAVRDVADILATAIREAESDGTYSTLGVTTPGTAEAGP